MTPSCIRKALAACALLSLTGPAVAHTTLETVDAPISSPYKAVLRVGHGCDGAPTLRLRVRIPDGVVAVAPVSKPGWTVETVNGSYGRTYDYRGTAVTEGVKEIIWAGTLPDGRHDEFVFQAYLSGDLQPDAVLYFPTVQECGDAKANRWIEIPADGRRADDYKHPAPGVKLLPAGSGEN